MSGRERPARKRRADLSQHFLRPQTAERLIRATSIQSTDFVIEVGAGRGALTIPLSKRAARVVAVELDAYLAQKLAQKLAADASPALEVVEGDFLNFELPDAEYAVVGNLPFARSTDIIRKLTTASPAPLDIWIVVHLELAHRLCGQPFSRESVWSLRLKPLWHVEIVDHLKRTEFDPPPGVDSVFLNLRHRGRTLVEAAHYPAFVRMVEGAFAANAPVARALRHQLSKRQLQRLAREYVFELTDVPAALCFEQWLGVFRFMQQLR